MFTIFKILTFNFSECIHSKESKKSDISSIYDNWKQIDIKLTFKLYGWISFR